MHIADNNTRVPVTGGAGFIGSHLTDRLAALAAGRVKAIRGDITDAATCEHSTYRCSGSCLYPLLNGGRVDHDTRPNGHFYE